MRISHHAPQSCGPPNPSITTPHSCCIPPKRTLSKLIKNKNQTKHIALHFFQHLFFHSSGICCMYTLLSNQPKHQNAHCNKSKCGSRPLAYHRHWVLTGTPFRQILWLYFHRGSLRNSFEAFLYWLLSHVLNVGCCFSPTVPSISFYFFFFHFPSISKNQSGKGEVPHRRNMTWKLNLLFWLMTLPQVKHFDC